MKDKNVKNQIATHELFMYWDLIIENPDRMYERIEMRPNNKSSIIEFITKYILTQESRFTF
jgi:hypothetical protein